jgi:cell fate regulator YaaT (PSP1 superfamily)
MATVIGVRFRNAGKLYYFDPGQWWPTAGDAVIVETVRGMEFGEVVTGVKEVSDDAITPPLKKVIRVATAEDAQHQAENRAREKDAMAQCLKKITEHKLQMKLVGCEYTFDNSKLLFYFTSDKRVDFRALVKDLASLFHTRIELRQIGVRDEAKMMGGLGLCGRPVCCGAFLGDFQPVSIKMAKEQNLSLNPTKISGVCGRLMCCLKYEEDHYEATRRRMPRIGRDVVTPDGVGTVVDLNILKETVRVRIPKGDSYEQKDYPLESVQRTQNGQRSAEKKPETAEAEQLPDGAVTETDEESLKEFALDEGISEEEARAEIEEIAQDEPEEMIDVEDEGEE